MPAVTKSRQIETDVLAVLSGMECEGTAARIVGGLDGKMYTRVNQVLESLGGKWSRKAGAHLFDGDAAEAIESAVLSGQYENPGDFGFFETPPAVVERLIDLADIEPGMDCLEPSAGRGAIARAMRESGGSLSSYTLVELLPKNVEALCDAGFSDLCIMADFLSLKPGDAFAGMEFGRVVMNPPFAPRQADINHVRHAFDFLKPGGRLVSVMSSGVVFRENRKTVEFREWLEAHGGEWETVADGAFRESGTDVRTVIVWVDKR